MGSASGKRGVTIPQLLLQEGEGLTLTLEGADGSTYRGLAEAADDSMNVSLTGVTVTAPDGAVRRAERLFLRGSTVVLVVLPDILAKSPMFDRVRALAAGRNRALGLGRARADAMQAKGACGGRRQAGG